MSEILSVYVFVCLKFVVCFNLQIQSVVFPIGIFLLPPKRVAVRPTKLQRKVRSRIRKR